MPSDPPITPAPVPTRPDAPPLILVFGGTFDPPHRGHIELPARVRDELERSHNCAGQAWILHVPAARSPHKAHGPIASDADRLEMLRLALAEADTPRAAIWTDELDRSAWHRRPAGDGRARAEAPPSFTIDTITRLRSWLDDHHAAGTELRLLIGADQALTFHRWRQPRDILRLAKPAVMLRGDMTQSDALIREIESSNFWEHADIAMWQGSIVPVGRIDVSASALREALRDHEIGTIDSLLAPSVRRYIQDHSLYSAPRP